MPNCRTISLWREENRSDEEQTEIHAFDFLTDSAFRNTRSTTGAGHRPPTSRTQHGRWSAEASRLRVCRSSNRQKWRCGPPQNLGSHTGGVRRRRRVVGWAERIEAAGATEVKSKLRDRGSLTRCAEPGPPDLCQNVSRCGWPIVPDGRLDDGPFNRQSRSDCRIRNIMLNHDHCCSISFPMIRRAMWFHRASKE